MSTTPSQSLAALASLPEQPVLKLPHPYLTPFSVIPSSRTLNGNSSKLFQLQPTQSAKAGKPLPEPLHASSLFFSDLADLESSQRPSESNNGPWARARRSPASTVTWTSTVAPTVGQVWLIIYVLFTVRPDVESFRLRLDGPGSEIISEQLQAVLIAIAHPPKVPASASEEDTTSKEILVLRSTFWQGAGSPFGPRPVWLPVDASEGSKPISSYPIAPLDYTLSATAPGAGVLAWHPRRPAKPRPGSVIYSRYIPHLKENFSMVALDYTNDEHLNLFHQWQNDPRVSQGWNETGTLDQHREYLRRAHEDPHQITILARFEDSFFAYFEAYWGKEDRLGAYYDADDFDRGRHSLVGDVSFRGPHRVSAWWSSLMHYLFLDDPRTKYVVGEPKATNSTVLSYDFIHGFGLDKFVDLPHKRSAFVRCSRERFFQLAPLAESTKVVGGTGVRLSAKL